MSISASGYENCVDVSERVAWKVNDVFPIGANLNFGKTFMPSGMWQGKTLSCLSEEEKRTLNQIYGNSYRYLFYFVEAYIIAMAMEHARAELYGDEHNLRAMLRFADEEVKHQQMFLRFGEMFERGFGSSCDLVDSPQAVAEVILSKSPMAVLLVTLHLEIITQAHFVDSMRESEEMEPLFKSLFRYHWMEEAQHAKLDVLELKKLRECASEEQVQQAIDDYFDICDAFGGLLAQQAKLDVVSLQRAVGRTFSPAELDEIEAAQRRSYHRAFLYDGLTSPQFIEFLKEHYPQAVERAAKAAEAFA
jgi:hypothetical protein